MGQPIEITISAILYQEGNSWIAQGLEYDITAQAPTLPALQDRFATKVAAEVAISLDLDRKPLEGIGRAPESFWRMFEKATMTVVPDKAPEIAISGNVAVPRIISRMKVGQLEAA